MWRGAPPGQEEQRGGWDTDWALFGAPLSLRCSRCILRALGSDCAGARWALKLLAGPVSLVGEEEEGSGGPDRGEAEPVRASGLVPALSGSSPSPFPPARLLQTPFYKFMQLIFPSACHASDQVFSLPLWNPGVTGDALERGKPSVRQ